MDFQQNDNKKKFHIDLSFDRTLLFLIIFLLAFGLVMIYSVSSYEAMGSQTGSAKFLKKQLFADVLGLVFLFIATYFPMNWLKNENLLTALYFISLVPLFLVPFIGIESHGAKRWLPVYGTLTWQPAELTKITVILFLACVTTKYARNIHRRANIFICMIIAFFPAGLVAVLTDNFSSAIIVGALGCVMIFICIRGYKLLILGVTVLAVVVPLAIYSISNMTVTEDTNFRFIRVLAWLNPEKYSQKTGFQTVQALYAIGSGGFFGKGLGQSMQKLGFIPEAQNDMIFSVICEELGLFGAIGIMIMFVILIWRMVIIATQCKDMFGTMLVSGVIAHISVQVIMNIAVVTNTMPNTGVSLPFISYGGTSVLFLLTEMGLVLNVGRQSSKALDREAGV